MIASDPLVTRIVSKQDPTSSQTYIQRHAGGRDMAIGQWAVYWNSAKRSRPSAKNDNDVPVDMTAAAAAGNDASVLRSTMRRIKRKSPRNVCKVSVHTGVWYGDAE